MNIDRILIPNKASYGEKNYKYFISYSDDDHEIKLLHNASENKLS